MIAANFANYRVLVSILLAIKSELFAIISNSLIINIMTSSKGSKRRAEQFRQRKALEVPGSRCPINNDKFNEFREFNSDVDLFMRRHTAIEHLTIGIDASGLKCPKVNNSMRAEAWMNLMLDSATKISSDTIIRDLRGFPFAFYVEKSLSPGNIVRLTAATKTFRREQEPSRRQDPDKTDRYESSQHLSRSIRQNLPAIYDLTSVELGHGYKGVRMSQELLELRTSLAYDKYLDFNEATLQALGAAAAMYYYLARDCILGNAQEHETARTCSTHQHFLQLAQNTYNNSSGFVKVLLGRPWSPFSQRRLVCNLNSCPHVDKSNDQTSLNSLTFYGSAKLWLVAIIGDRPYAFRVVAGATLLFPASLFIHFTAGWEEGDRYVLTNWTSNQLGYRDILEQFYAS